MKKALFFIAVAFFSSCTLKEQEHLTDKIYFDVDRYFNAEAVRLTKANALINKTVLVNAKTEEKEIKIIDWKKEFDSFISADINKASWKGSFSVQKNDSLATYTSQSDKIAVKKLEIAYKKGKIYAIKIFISNSNSLYVSRDSLSYYPDSLYEINKTQRIKLMDEKKYRIIGKFK